MINKKPQILDESRLNIRLDCVKNPYLFKYLDYK